jgi:aspartate oxidase
MVITYALMETLEDLVEKHPARVQIVKKARVTRLLKTADGTVTGVEYEHQGQTRTVCSLFHVLLTQLLTR